MTRIRRARPHLDVSWRDVLGYEGKYQVSDEGHVYSLTANRLLSQNLDPKGKPRVTLYQKESPQKRVVRVHVLVLEAFVGPRPPGMEACHYDDVGTNNQLSNLRWDTPSGNTKDRVRNGLHNMARKTHCPKNHSYDEKNTCHSGGRRFCRTCHRDAARRTRANRSEKAKASA